jgi:chromosome segregation ATPase
VQKEEALKQAEEVRRQMYALQTALNAAHATIQQLRLELDKERERSRNLEVGIGFLQCVCADLRY